MIAASSSPALALDATFGIESDFIHSSTKPPRFPRHWSVALLALAAVGCGGGTDVTAVPRERVSNITANFSGKTFFGGDSLQVHAAAYGPTGDSLPGRIVSLSALTPNVATITAPAEIHTYAAGTALFAATAGGFTDTLQLQVVTQVARVIAIPDSMSFAVGDTLDGPFPFVVHAYAASGREIEDVAVYYDITKSLLSYTRNYTLVASHAGTGVITVIADTAKTNVKVMVTAVTP